MRWAVAMAAARTPLATPDGTRIAQTGTVGDDSRSPAIHTPAIAIATRCQLPTTNGSAINAQQEPTHRIP